MPEHPIRVLLLEDDAGDARLAQIMLDQGAAGQFELTCVTRLADALQCLQGHTFDVILSDLAVPDSKGLGTFEKLQAQAPNLPIVVLSGLDDENTAMKAVQQGAQDYLIKGQVNRGLMVRSLRYAIERKRKLDVPVSRPRGKVIAFVGGKGGVGTTTAALNVAAVLNQRGHSTILVEFRPYFGTLALMLRLTPAENLSHVLDLGPETISERDLSTRLIRTAFGVRVLFGPQKAEESQRIEPETAGAILEALSGMAAYTILDLPCQPSLAAEVALRRANQVVLVVEREPISVTSSRVLLEVLRFWGVSKATVHVLAMSRASLTVPPDLPEIRSKIGCEIAGVIPPAADACLLAIQSGLPLVLSHPKHFAAEAFVEATQRLLNHQSVEVAGG